MCKLTRSLGTNQLKLGFQTNPNLGFKPTQTWVWIYCIWIKNDVGYKVTGYLEYFCTITYFFFFFPKVVTEKFGWVICMFLFFIDTIFFHLLERKLTDDHPVCPLINQFPDKADDKFKNVISILLLKNSWSRLPGNSLQVFSAHHWSILIFRILMEGRLLRKWKYFDAHLNSNLSLVLYIFRTNKKIPRGPPSPPAPVMHSPSRKVRESAHQMNVPSPIQ